MVLGVKNLTNFWFFIRMQTYGMFLSSQGCGSFKMKQLGGVLKWGSGSCQIDKPRRECS
jgi:hypothetical protein